MAGQSSKKYEVLSSANWFVQGANGIITGGHPISPASPDDFRQGDVIEGVERMIKYRTLTKDASGWKSGLVVDMGSDKYGRRKYVWRNQVIPYTGKPAGGENFSGVDGAANPTPPIVTALPSILSSIGFIWGLSYAFSKQKKFWGYVGYSFLGSVGGAAVGGLVTVIAYPQSARTHGADGSGRRSKWSLFKSKVKGKCTCPDGQRYPCTGADSCRECCKEALSSQKYGCAQRDDVSCCRPKRWKFNNNSNQYECR